jgi:hypothetical protein
MSRFRAAFCIFTLSFLCFFNIGLLYGQRQGGYPSFNGGTVINSTTGTPGDPGTAPGPAPTSEIVQLDGTTITLNGLEPGAQVNIILVNGTETWTSSEADSVESTIETGIAQSWPGTPYPDYPTPTVQITDTLPTIDQDTGFVGATTQNVIAVVQLDTPDDVEDECVAGAGGCTGNTFDPATAYTTSEYTSLSPDSLESASVTHEVDGHGLDNLTDCVSCDSSMYYIEGSQTPSFSPTDLDTIHLDFENPVTPPQPPLSCPNQ